MKPVGLALKRAGLAVALLGLLSPAMFAPAEAQSAICTEGTGIQGVDVTLDCHDDTCDFTKDIAAHAHWSVVGNCHQDGETSPGKLSLADADECVSCTGQNNDEKLACKNIGDRRVDYTVTVFCR